MLRFPRHIVDQLGWITGTFVASQILRLATNVILARLLAPQIFGIMAIVNSIRTGAELISDVGIGQNIVSDRDGDKQSFVNTAWTIQIIRGAVLGLLVFVAAGSIGKLYDDPNLVLILQIMSLIFVFTGLASPSRFLLQKWHQSKKLTNFDLALGVLNAFLNISFALYSPTVWALVAATMVYCVISAVATFFLTDWRGLRVEINRDYFRRIISFGKWIFLSSIIFFVSTNFDRLYLGAQIPLAVLGVYGIARTLSEAVTLLTQRVSSLIVFPRIAASKAEGAELRQRISRSRAQGLLVISIALGGAIAFADLIVILIYDDRYIGAAFILPLLLLGVWFSVLATIGESVLFGIGKPASSATGNMAKLLWVVLLLPVGLTSYGVVAAFIVLALADLPRYLVIAVVQRRKQLSFVRTDVSLTLLLLLTALLVRMAIVQLGFVPGIASFTEYASALQV